MVFDTHSAKSGAESRAYLSSNRENELGPELRNLYDKEGELMQAEDIAAYNEKMDAQGYQSQTLIFNPSGEHDVGSMKMMMNEMKEKLQARAGVTEELEINTAIHSNADGSNMHAHLDVNFKKDETRNALKYDRQMELDMHEVESHYGLAKGEQERHEARLETMDSYRSKDELMDREIMASIDNDELKVNKEAGMEISNNPEAFESRYEALQDKDVIKEGGEFDFDAYAEAFPSYADNLGEDIASEAERIAFEAENEGKTDSAEHIMANTLELSGDYSTDGIELALNEKNSLIDNQMAQSQCQSLIDRSDEEAIGSLGDKIAAMRAEHVEEVRQANPDVSREEFKSIVEKEIADLEPVFHEKAKEAYAQVQQEFADDKAKAEVELEGLKSDARDLEASMSEKKVIAGIAERDNELLSNGKIHTSGIDANDNNNIAYQVKLDRYESHGFIQENKEVEGLYEVKDERGLRNEIANSIANAKDTVELGHALKHREQADLLKAQGVSNEKINEITSPDFVANKTAERTELVKELQKHSSDGPVPNEEEYAKADHAMSQNIRESELNKITSQESQLLNSEKGEAVTINKPSSKLNHYLENGSLIKTEEGAFIVAEQVAFAKSVNSQESKDLTAKKVDDVVAITQAKRDESIGITGGAKAIRDELNNQYVDNFKASQTRAEAEAAKENRASDVNFTRQEGREISKEEAVGKVKETAYMRDNANDSKTKTEFSRKFMDANLVARDGLSVNSLQDYSKKAVESGARTQEEAEAFEKATISNADSLVKAGLMSKSGDGKTFSFKDDKAKEILFDNVGESYGKLKDLNNDAYNEVNVGSQSKYPEVKSASQVQNQEHGVSQNENSKSEPKADVAQKIASSKASINKTLLKTGFMDTSKSGVEALAKKDGGRVEALLKGIDDVLANGGSVNIKELQQRMHATAVNVQYSGASKADKQAALSNINEATNRIQDRMMSMENNGLVAKNEQGNSYEQLGSKVKDHMNSSDYEGKLNYDATKDLQYVKDAGSSMGKPGKSLSFKERMESSYKSISGKEHGGSMKNAGIADAGSLAINGTITLAFEAVSAVVSKGGEALAKALGKMIQGREGSKNLLNDRVREVRNHLSMSEKKAMASIDKADASFYKAEVGAVSKEAVDGEVKLQNNKTASIENLDPQPRRDQSKTDNKVVNDKVRTDEKKTMPKPEVKKTDKAKKDIGKSEKGYYGSNAAKMSSEAVKEQSNNSAKANEQNNTVKIQQQQLNNSLIANAEVSKSQTQTNVVAQTKKDDKTSAMKNAAAINPKHKTNMSDVSKAVADSNKGQIKSPQSGHKAGMASIKSASESMAQKGKDSIQAQQQAEKDASKSRGNDSKSSSTEKSNNAPAPKTPTKGGGGRGGR